MKLHEWFGFEKIIKGDIGIEIEVEAKEELPRRNLPQGWKYHAEGSLRGNSAEYVTRGALEEDDKKLSKITALTDILKKCKVNEDSHRTSTHIHINVQEFPLTRIYSVILCYWLVENLLVKFCGEEKREGNHFCLRLTDAETPLTNLVRDVQKERYFHYYLAHRDERYSALNLSSLPQFGSLEFRSMRGTIDPELIAAWSTELFGMAHTAAAFAPDELLDYYYTHYYDTQKQFLGTFFSNDFVRILTTIPNWRTLLDENVGLLCELAYATNWKEADNKLKQTLKELKENQKKAKQAMGEQQQVHEHQPVRGGRVRRPRIGEPINFGLGEMRFVPR